MRSDELNGIDDALIFGFIKPFTVASPTNQSDFTWSNKTIFADSADNVHAPISPYN